MSEPRETVENIRGAFGLLLALDPEAQRHETLLAQVFDDMIDAFRDAETHRHYGVEDEPHLSNAVDWLCAHALMMNSIINSLAQHLARAAEIPEELVTGMISEGSRDKLLEISDKMHAAIAFLREHYPVADKAAGSKLVSFRTTAHDRD